MRKDSFTDEDADSLVSDASVKFKKISEEVKELNDDF